MRLLADLTCTGDAYTHHGGIDFSDAGQSEFDFKESQESESLFPACAVTGSFDDLHLVVHTADDTSCTELLVPSARAGLSGFIKLSVPLTILPPGTLKTLETTGQIPVDTSAAAVLRRWYAEDASAEWNRLRHEHDKRQRGFAFSQPDELRF